MTNRQQDGSGNFADDRKRFGRNDCATLLHRHLIG